MTYLHLAPPSLSPLLFLFPGVPPLSLSLSFSHTRSRTPGGPSASDPPAESIRSERPIRHPGPYRREAEGGGWVGGRRSQRLQSRELRKRAPAVGLKGGPLPSFFLERPSPNRKSFFHLAGCSEKSLLEPFSFGPCVCVGRCFLARSEELPPFRLLDERARPIFARHW